MKSFANISEVRDEYTKSYSVCLTWQGAVHTCYCPCANSLLTQVSHILYLLDSGESLPSIQSQTGSSTSTISNICSKHHPNLSKSPGDHPRLLTNTSINYAKHAIHTGKVDNAVQAVRMLQSHSRGNFFTQTLHWRLKKSGMKAVVKKK